jgi:hypothetical protein
MLSIMRSNGLQRSLKAKDPILNVTIHELSTKLGDLILFSLSLCFLSDLLPSSSTFLALILPLLIYSEEFSNPFLEGSIPNLCSSSILRATRGATSRRTVSWNIRQSARSSMRTLCCTQVSQHSHASALADHTICVRVCVCFVIGETLHQLLSFRVTE